MLNEWYERSSEHKNPASTLACQIDQMEVAVWKDISSGDEFIWAKHKA